ncbi:hypothetical protein Tco_0289441, partial [Tanacetum coccineum]
VRIKFLEVTSESFGYKFRYEYAYLSQSDGQRVEKNSSLSKICLELALYVRKCRLACLLAEVGEVQLTMSRDRTRETEKIFMLKQRIQAPLRWIDFNFDDKLQFVEEPIKITDHEVKRLMRSTLSISQGSLELKRGPEFTWEREDQFRKKYPHLFTKTAPSSSAVLVSRAKVIKENQSNVSLLDYNRFQTLAYIQQGFLTVSSMSDSEDSTVTYTEIPSPYEDPSDMGSPGVEGPIFQDPPSPDYVPGPEEPEQAPPSPIYVPFVPEPREDLRRMTERYPEEDPADYPADRGDDDDDDDAEEEEHLAPADPAAVAYSADQRPITMHIASRLNVHPTLGARPNNLFSLEEVAEYYYLVPHVATVDADAYDQQTEETGGDFRSVENSLLKTEPLVEAPKILGTVTNEVAYAMTWSDVKKKMTTKYCLRNEIKKIEAELWNLKVKGQPNGGSITPTIQS